MVFNPLVALLVGVPYALRRHHFLGQLVVAVDSSRLCYQYKYVRRPLKWSLILREDRLVGRVRGLN